MKVALQKILLLTAIITVLTHSLLPHIHHDETLTITNQHHHDEDDPAGKHHDENKSEDNDRSIFSFAQLDEHFIPAKGQAKSFEWPVTHLHVLIVTFLPNNFSARTKTRYGGYREHPPPDDYCDISFLRGPPIA